MAGSTVADQDRTGLRRLLLLTGWILGLTLGIVLFHQLGSGPLQAPPLASPGQWSSWAAQREPLQAVMALLRLVVLALSWYLVGVTTIGLVAYLSRIAGLIRLAEVLTVPVLRRGLQAVLGLGLATAMVGASVPGFDGAPSSRTAVAASTTVVDSEPAASADGGTGMDPWVEADAGHDEPGSSANGEREFAPSGQPAPYPLELLARPGSSAVEPPSGRDVSSPVTEREEHPVPDFDSMVDFDPVPDPESTPASEQPSLPPAHVASAEEATATSYDVVAGDSLWRIAARSLEQYWGRMPSDAQVVPYWEQVIAANRQHLVDPGNPDLLFPGQQLVLPAPPEPPTPPQAPPAPVQGTAGAR